MDTIKEFHLLRVEDESGVSGTGVVARGCILPSGRVVLEWQTFHTSINLYQNFDSIDAIHGHHGKTKVIMGPPPPPEEVKPKRSRKKKNESTQT